MSLETPEQIIDLSNRVDAAVQDNNIIATWDLADQLDAMCIRLGPHMARAIEAVRSIHRKSEHQRRYGFPRADKSEHYCIEDQQSWPCQTQQAIDDINNLERDNGQK